MSYEIFETVVKVRVSGWPALPIAFNADSGMFLPDFVYINITPGYPMDITVSGPVLNEKTGQPYKTKRGMSSFDVEDLDKAPVELKEIVGKVRQEAVA